MLGCKQVYTSDKSVNSHNQICFKAHFMRCHLFWGKAQHLKNVSPHHTDVRGGGGGGH